VKNKGAAAFRLLFSVVLICTVLMYSFPLSVFAASGDVSTWAEFVKEFNSIKDTGGTITLTADIAKDTSTREEFAAAIAGVTIDTNGHSIIISSGTVTFGSHVTITGSTDYKVPLKAAGTGEAATAEILLDGATVKKYSPALGAVVEIGQYGVLRTIGDGTLIQGVNSALDVNDGGKAYHEYGSILAINTGIGAATGVYVRAGGEMQVISANVSATSKGAIGILVDGFLRLAGSATAGAGGDSASGIVIQSGGEANVENGGVVAYNGEGTSGVRVTGGELTLRGGTVYGVTDGILATPSSQILVTGTAVVGQRGTSVNISKTGIRIEGANGQGTLLTIEDGTVKGTEIGVKAENHCDVEITGGCIDASSEASGCGILLSQSSAMTIDGASVLGGISVSGCGISALPFTTVTVNQGEGKATAITGGKGALVSGTLRLNGGTMTGLNTYGIEIGEGGKLIMHGGDISGTGTGIVTNNIGDMAEIWGGMVFGTEIGINNAGSLSMMGGNVTGGNDNGLSLGSTSQTVLYHGAAASHNEGANAIFAEGDPELCVYSGFSGGDNIYIEDGHTNYVTRQSLTLSSLPDTVALTMGENRTVTMTPDGQALDGAIMLLEDILGAGPVTLQSGSDNIASFTVSGNEITFTPISTGTAELAFDDTITYSGRKTIIINVDDPAGGDTTPPTVSAVLPSGNNVSVNVPELDITFNEPMDTAATGTVSIDNSAILSGIGAWSDGNKTITYTVSGLVYGTEYNIGISAFKDIAGNAMIPDYSHSFTTMSNPDTNPPVISFGFTAGYSFSSSPESLTMTVSEAVYEIDGGEEVTNVNINDIGLIEIKKDGTVFNDFTLSYDKGTRTITVSPLDSFPNGSYTLKVKAGIAKDSADNELAEYSRSFTVAATAVTDISVNPSALAYSGGNTMVTITGVKLSGHEIKVLLDDAEAAAAAVNSEINATASVVIPQNTSSSIKTHTITATLDGIVVADREAVVTVNRKPSGSDSSSHRSRDNNGNSNPVSAPLLKATVRVSDSNANIIDNVAVTMNNSTGTASMELDAAQLNAAFDKSKSNGKGIRAIRVDMPEIDGANAYESTLPAGFLTSGDATKTVEINTGIAAVTLSGSMLNMSDAAGGKKISLTIAAGDKSKLDTAVQAQIGDRPVIELSMKIDGKQTSWSNESAPVTITIPYTPTAEELKDPEHITVWYIDGSGKAVAVPNGRYDPATGKVTFTTTHFSQYAVTFAARSFNDLGSVAWAKKAIEVLTSKGILRGVSETEYAPQTNITRADFLYFLIRTLGVDAKIDGNFDDISSDAYYYKEIAIAKKLGITSGSGNNKFSPDASITRQDMMVLTERALRILKRIGAQGTASDLDKFADKSLVAAYAVNGVASVVKEGLIEGSDDRINPMGNAARGEVAVFLYRIYNK